MKMIRKIYEKGRIYINCIIITTIIGGLMASCAAPRSVRPTGTHSSSNKTPIKQEYKAPEKKKEKQSIVTNEEVVKQTNEAEKNELIQESNIPQTEEIESTAIAGLSGNETEVKVNEELPSLVQQLRMLNAGQEDIQKNIYEIKNTINDIDSRITKLENGNFQKKRDLADIPKPRSNKSSVILPDEVVKNQAPKNNKKPKTYIPKKEDLEESEFADNKNEPAKEVQSISNEQLKNELDAVKAIVNKRDYGEAIKKLTKMVEEVKDPVSLNVCNFYLGESHYGLRQYSKAIDYYEKVLDFGKTDKTDDALIGIAEAKFRLGNISEAKEAYQKFMKTFPKSEHTPTARKMLQQI